MSRPRAQVGIVNPGHCERGLSAGNRGLWPHGLQTHRTHAGGFRPLPLLQAQPGAIPPRKCTPGTAGGLPAQGSCPFPRTLPTPPPAAWGGATGDFLEAHNQPLSHPRETLTGEDSLLLENKQTKANQQKEYRNM